MIKAIGLSNYGNVSIAVAISGIGVIITDYGFNTSATRTVATCKNSIKSLSNIFCSVLILKIMLFLIFVVIFIILNNFINIEKDLLGLIYISFGSIFSQCLYPIWFLQGIEKMSTISILSTASHILTFLLTISLVNDLDDTHLVILALVISQFACALLSQIWIFQQKLVKICLPSFDDLLSFLRSGFNMFIVSSTSTIYTFAVPLFLGVYFTSVEVGQYTVANKIIQVVKAIYNTVGQALYPRLSILFKNDFSRAKKYLNFTLLIFTPICILIVAIVVKYSNGIILYFIGYTDYSTILTLKYLCMLPPIVAIGSICGVLGLYNLNAEKKVRDIIVICGVIYISVMVIAGNKLSFFAAVNVTVVVELLITLSLCIAYFWEIRKREDNNEY